jgi:hypothetical protein
MMAYGLCLECPLIVYTDLDKPHQNFVYISGELNRPYRIVVTPRI